MAMRRGRKWLIGIAIPVAVIALVALLFRWDWLIPLIEPRASAALGRPVTLEHLHVKLGRTVVVTADGVTVGNPEGFGDPVPLARVGRLSAAVNAWDWWQGRGIVLPWIEVDKPVLNVRALPDGRNNYTFETAAPAADAPPADPANTPRLGVLRIRDGEGKVVIPQLRADFAIRLATEEDAPEATAEAVARAADTPVAAPEPAPEPSMVIAENGLPLPAPPAPEPPPLDGDLPPPAALADEPARIVASAEGTYADQPIRARLVGGALLSLRDSAKPWPVQLRVDNGPTNVSLEGTISDPLNFQGAALRLVLVGPDASLLTPLTGVPVPKTPPYRLAGALDYAADRIRMERIRGTLGSTDLSGSIAVLPRQPRPDVTVNLTSRQVDLDDLAGFIGETPGGAAPARADARLLPTTPVSLPKLTAADLHVRYRAGNIRGGQRQPLDNLRADFDIVDGVIDLHPIGFGIGRGQMLFTGTLAPAGNGLRADVKAEFQRLDISKLMLAAGSEGGGALNGRAELKSTGASVAQLLGNGDGRLVLSTAGGNLSALLVDLSGLRLANAVLSALGLPTRTELRCFIGDFALRDGTLNTNAMIIDTESSIIVGDGNVNLARETLAYRLRTRSRDFTIGALSTDIRISGALREPSVMPEVMELGARGGAALGLALINPLLAILPTIQFGTSEDSGCTGLAQRAGQRR